MAHSPEPFEILDRQMESRLKGLRGQKLPDGLLTHFSKEVEDKIRQKQVSPVFSAKQIWLGAAVPTLAVMVLAAWVVLKTPGAMQGSAPEWMSPAVAELEALDYALVLLDDTAKDDVLIEEMDAIGADEIDLDDVDEETLKLLDEIA